MINRYYIRLKGDAAILVDEATAQRWRFTGGYDASARLVTEVDCDRLAAWMGERGEYAGTLLEALGESDHG